MSAEEVGLLSIVVPVYNEQDNLADFYGNLLQVMQQEDYDYEIIFVNDGSGDDSAAILDGFAKENRRCKVVHFST